MKVEPMDREAILERYPEKKPVCFNYFTARTDVLTLLAEKEELARRLTELQIKE